MAHTAPHHDDVVNFYLLAGAPFRIYIVRTFFAWDNDHTGDSSTRHMIAHVIAHVKKLRVPFVTVERALLRSTPTHTLNMLDAHART